MHTHTHTHRLIAHEFFAHWNRRQRNDIVSRVHEYWPHHIDDANSDGADAMPKPVAPQECTRLLQSDRSLSFVCPIRNAASLSALRVTHCMQFASW